MESLHENPARPVSASVEPLSADAELLARLRKGDDDALPPLMERYDRLVRYTVFRLSRACCFRDPQWLDAVASEVWMGFLRSIQREDCRFPESLAAFLTRIARNQTVSALRRRGLTTIPNDRADFSEADKSTLYNESPDRLVESYEQILALRECVIGLTDNERETFSQLHLIVERRWTEAAGKLKISESTLRSRWKQVLEMLKSCLESKSAPGFAPRGLHGDSFMETKGA
jgi:RNA polymerase sigma factor (sigma-70 family)